MNLTYLLFASSNKNEQFLFICSNSNFSALSLPLSTDKLVTDGLVGELDSNLTDIELLEQWNPMYDVFGYLISEFRTKWEKERTKEYKFQTFQKSEDYEELSQRLSKMEFEFNKFKIKMNKPMSMMG